MTVKHYVVNNNVDILALTATWLRPGNCDDLKVGVLCPGAYSFLHVPGIHGIAEGMCFLSKYTLTINSVLSGDFKSFEVMHAPMLALYIFQVY